MIGNVIIYNVFTDYLDRLNTKHGVQKNSTNSRKKECLNVKLNFLNLCLNFKPSYRPVVRFATQ